MLLDEKLNDLLQELKKLSVPTHTVSSEEEQSLPPPFVESASSVGDRILEVSDGGEEIVRIDPKVTEAINFEAFLDGVQRTVMWRRIPLRDGGAVPVHIAHICAGIILRDKRDVLHLPENFIASRLLVLAPFKGLEEAGVTFETLREQGERFFWDTSEHTFAFPKEPDEWIICDTTFPSTDTNRLEFSDNCIIGERLLDEGLVRGRAQGRVATLRQRLEMALLAKFRKEFPMEWILVDGPLFFIDKWRKRAFKIFKDELSIGQEGDLEDKLLRFAVGIIKSHRLKPKNPQAILKIAQGERSTVRLLSQEVDVKGRGSHWDESGGYASMHFTWYTRFRLQSQRPLGFAGLIRLDIHKSTLNIVRTDTLDVESFREYVPIINDITVGVWNERSPQLPRGSDLRSFAEPYPIYQLEKILKATIYPRRFLSYLLETF
jgi:hypothetical protein